MICMYEAVLVVDVFENFQSMCLEVYELDFARFLTVPGLSGEAALKNKSKIRSINYYWYVINGRKRW